MTDADLREKVKAVTSAAHLEALFDNA